MIRFSCEYTEKDPYHDDIGKAEKIYTITQNDIDNGFSVVLEVSIRENDGNRKGVVRIYKVTFKF